MNFKAMALLLIMMFAGGLAVSQEMGLISITAYTTSTTYEGDAVGITYADVVSQACDAPWTIEYKVSRFPGSVGNVWVFRTYRTGALVSGTMVSDSTSWVAQEPALYTISAKVFCAGNPDAITPQSGYNFNIYEKPADITCTNDCTILGSRDVAYGECPYRKCGYYDADPCLEWSAPITDSTCLPQNTICIDGVCTNEVFGPCRTDSDCIVTPPVTCPTDAYQCPDGSYVSRDIDNDCNFFMCPAQMCESIWKTGAWSECKADGFQVRQVFDYNQCAEPTGVMPDNKQTCTPPVDIVDPVCGTYQKISESDCIEGKKLVQYENSCGEEMENFETCVSDEFFDQKTIIMIALVMAAIVAIAVLFSKKK